MKSCLRAAALLSVAAAVGIASTPLLGSELRQSGTAKPPATSTAQPPATPTAKPPAEAKGAKPAMAADAAFIREAAIGGMAEVELGQLGAKNASSPDVKQFAQRMVDDHSKANDELKSLASQKNVTLPTGTDAKHKAVRDKLEKLQGAAFDSAYMSEMVKDHNTDVALFQREAKDGKDADAKAWAAKTLPTLQEHQKMAKDTHSKLGGAKPAAKPASKPATK
jgi:putative membrane protein